MRIDLAVTLKTTDLVRETARRTLVEDLHWAGCLESLARAELWRFAAQDSDPAAFRGALAAEVERGSTYYNPNKESHTWLLDPPLPQGEPLAEADAGSADDFNSGSAWCAELWVTDEGGARNDLLSGAALRFQKAGVRLVSIHKGTLWTFGLRAESAGAARGAVAGMALSRGRTAGLLFNPHYQEGRLLTLAEKS